VILVIVVIRENFSHSIILITKITVQQGEKFDEKTDIGVFIDATDGGVGD
jgi:hypothetical protein